jgi:hypothetical protein
MVKTATSLQHETGEYNQKKNLTPAPPPVAPEATAQRTNLNETERVQNMLRTFAQKLKFQRFHSQFETDQFKGLQRTQENEHEELSAKLYLEIKKNLAMAYESDIKASFHHFVVAEKLCRLKEHVVDEEF